MSKPKPGLGKVVRGLVHSPSGSAYSNLNNVVNTAVSYSTSTSSSASSGVGSSSLNLSPSSGGYGYVAARREFASLGIPLSSSSSSPSSSSSSSGPGSISSSSAISSSPASGYYARAGGVVGWNGWEDREIVKSFRPSRPVSATPKSSTGSSSTARTARSHYGTPPTSTTGARARRPLSTLSPSPGITLPGDVGGIFSSIPQIPLWSALLDKTLTWSNSFSSSSSSMSSSLDLIAIPPSPPPRGIRPNEIHPALSPSPSPLSDTTSSITNFVTLGIPLRYSSHLAPISAIQDDIPHIALSTSQLIFHLGASGLAKERPAYNPPPSRSRSPTPPPRPRTFPLPDIDSPTAAELRSVGVGEDAYFARVDGMCIADGVGGWARSGRGGADAGRWSRLLTHFCEVELGSWSAGRGVYAVDTGSSSSESNGKWSEAAWKNAQDQGVTKGKKKAVDPVEIMQRGFENCLSCFTSEGIHGSSTCLLALLNESTLSIANLGDCCLIVIRSNEIVFRTDEMQHAFNFPLQLGTHSRDEPMKDAARYDVDVMKGDIVVLGSDGLMDNLFDEDILETLEQFSAPDSTKSGDLPPFSPQTVSDALCRRARAVSEQTSATTPFMVRAIEEGIDFVGGKKDDISVVVGVIGDQESGEQDGLALHTR